MPSMSVAFLRLSPFVQNRGRCSQGMSACPAAKQCPTSPSVAKPPIAALPARTPNMQGQILAEAKPPPFHTHLNQGHSNIAGGEGLNRARRRHDVQCQFLSPHPNVITTGNSERHSNDQKNAQEPHDACIAVWTVKFTEKPSSKNAILLIFGSAHQR